MTPDETLAHHAYAEDPAGHFRTSAHHSVLAHMTTPDDTYGWNDAGLFARVFPLVQNPEHVAAIARDLADGGDAEMIAGGWTQTAQGHEKLSGSIANEPPEGSIPSGPATIRSNTPIPKR